MFIFIPITKWERLGHVILKKDEISAQMVPEIL